MMAEIVVLTKEAKNVLQRMVFQQIATAIEGTIMLTEPELNTLHKIYSDIVNTNDSGLL